MFGSGHSAAAITRQRKSDLEIVKSKIEALSKKESLNEDEVEFLNNYLKHIDQPELLKYLLMNGNKAEIIINCYPQLKKYTLIKEEYTNLYKVLIIIDTIQKILITFTLIFGFISAIPTIISILNIILGKAKIFECYIVLFWSAILLIIGLCSLIKKKIIQKI